MFASIYPQPTVLSSGSPSAVKFPEDVQVILRADRPSAGSLFIGNVEAAENRAILESLKIQAVLCVAKGYATKHSSAVVRHSKYLPVDDGDSADISKFLPEAVAFIAEKLKTTNVLVHCVAGTNRSAVFVMAFLMKQMGLTLEDAYSEVKSRRKVISPGEEMVAQLRLYEKSIGGLQSPPPSIRLSLPSPADLPAQRSVRIKTALNASNFLEVADIRSNRGSKAGSKVRMDELDDRRSLRPASCHSRPHPAIEISQPKGRNPEESFISRQSKAPSALDKSFYAPSQANRSQLQSALPSGPAETESRECRESFLQKLQRREWKNREINQRMEVVQERFEHSAQSQRLQMERQLEELSQVRSQLHSQQSGRKGKLAERRALHDKSMENRQAQEYIDSLPLQTAAKRT